MAAAHLFLEIDGPDGPIEGESEIEGFENLVVIEDWKWGVAREKLKDFDLTVPQVFEFSKPLDRSTTALLKCMYQKKPLNWVKVHVRDLGGVEFKMTVTLTNVRVIGYDIDGKVGDKLGEIDEDWKFDYDLVDIKYSPMRRRVSEASRDRKTYSKSETSGVVSATLVRPDNASDASPASDAVVKVTEVVRELTPAKRTDVFAEAHKKSDEWQQLKQKNGEK